MKPKRDQAAVLAALSVVLVAASGGAVTIGSDAIDKNTHARIDLSGSNCGASSLHCLPPPPEPPIPCWDGTELCQPTVPTSPLCDGGTCDKAVITCVGDTCVSTGAHANSVGDS